MLGALAGGTSGLIVVSRSGRVSLNALETIADLSGAQPIGAPTGPILVARGDDGLLFTLTLTNVVIQRNDDKTSFALQNGAMDGYIAVGLPNQAVFEETDFDDGSVPFLPPTPPVPTEMSGPSQIVFKLPAHSAPVGGDLATLFGGTALPLSVSVIANKGNDLTGPQPPPRPAENKETAIEAPWSLILSPSSASTFIAESEPVTRHHRTELWHARAVNNGRLTTPGSVAIRAVFAVPPSGTSEFPDGGGPNGDDFVSLLPDDRNRIVRATTLTDTNGALAAAAASDLLLVSPMGASLDVTGHWPDRNDLVAWRHLSWLGRDNYVKVDIPGHLFPFGFPAVLIKITDRIVLGGLAFLRKREFVVVRHPTIAYGGPFQPNSGNGLPFTQVTTTTLVSPPLVSETDAEKIGPQPQPPPPNPGVGAFWVQTAGPHDLRYQLIFTAQDGRVVHSDLPAVFVPDEVISNGQVVNPAFDPSIMGQIVSAWNSADQVTRRTLNLGGQKMGFVPLAPPSLSATPEETALPTTDIILDSQVGTGTLTDMLTARALNAFPVMDTADVHIEALDTVSSGPVPTTTNIAFKDTYVTHAFHPTLNKGEVWAVINTPTTLTIPQQTAGGLAAPMLPTFGGLSRALGPTMDPDNIATGNFDPTKYFPVKSINLLGGIVLSDVVAPDPNIDDIRGSGGANVPKVITTRTDTAIDTVVTWQPTLQALLNGLFVPAPPPGDDSRLHLLAHFHTDLANPSSTTTTITGDLRNFELNFVGAKDSALYFITQHVNRLHFESRDGAKPSVDVNLGQTTFGGELAFIQGLERLLPALPGGASISVTPDGVNAALSLAVPSIGFGILTLQNLGIGLGLALPFNGDQASLTFDFATRDHPFQLTISIFGGGGFLGITLGTRAVQSIEGSLEFGVATAIDLGVASGSVSIMAGIYFKFTEKTDANGNATSPGSTVVITGFVRADGKLEVLDLISVSLEFYLGLTYTSTGNKLEGDCVLSVSVSVACFSTTVQLSMHKEFSAGSDPTFGSQLTAGEWDTYCAAFAA